MLKNTSSSEKNFLKRQIFSLYSTLDLIKSKAISFNVSLNEIGLNNYELEKFLYL